MEKVAEEEGKRTQERQREMQRRMNPSTVQDFEVGHRKRHVGSWLRPGAFGSVREGASGIGRICSEEGIRPGVDCGAASRMGEAAQEKLQRCISPKTVHGREGDAGVPSCGFSPETRV